jgi:hypothetical protein
MEILFHRSHALRGNAVCTAPAVLDAERPYSRSHAEHGNDTTLTLSFRRSNATEESCWFKISPVGRNDNIRSLLNGSGAEFGNNTLSPKRLIQ